MSLLSTDPASKALTPSTPGMQPQQALSGYSAQPPNGLAHGSSPHHQQQQGFDIWGPLQRRKYLVTLFCIIGAALGYLYFAKTAPTYESVTRLMISTQAPPRIVNGDMVMDNRVSIAKHVNLVASDLVLSDAVREGRLGEMITFEEEPFPVFKLKLDMLKIVPDIESEVSMTISCRGPEANELPTILNQIVAAYKRNLKSDSQLEGKEGLVVMEQRASQLSEEKAKAEKRMIELYAQLPVTKVNVHGLIINPYEERAQSLIVQHDEVRAELRQISDRLRMLQESVATGDKDVLKALAHEAKLYLKLVEADFQTDVGQLPGLPSRGSLEQRTLTLNNYLDEVRFSRDEQARTLGKGHRVIKSMDKRILYYQKEIAEVQSQLSSYDQVQQKFMQKMAGSEGEMGDEKTSRQMDLQQFRALEEQAWITMYGLTLDREKIRLTSNQQAIATEVQQVSGEAKKVAEKVMEYNVLQRKIAEMELGIQAIYGQMKSLGILSASYTETKVKVLDPPLQGLVVAPSLPVSLAAGTMLAFLVGLGLAILVDYSELAFRSPYEIMEKLNIPVVGRIPRIDVRKIQPTKGVASLIVAHKPGSTAAESFRDIRTALFFQANVNDIKTIQFTSPSPGDGKSTTAANLAISIAQAGKRVILVDADFRRPRIHQYFDEPLNPGLLDVLGGEAGISDAIKRSELQENLYLLTSGGRPKNPGELVTSEAFRDLILALREKFDYVFIDTPPILPVSDPATVASIVDGVYMVSRIRKGIKVTTQKAKETLDRVGANWMGIIVNGIDENPHYNEYGYQYGGTTSYYGGLYGRYYEASSKEYRDKIGTS